MTPEFANPLAAFGVTAVWALLVWLIATLNYRLLRNPDSGVRISQILSIIVVLFVFASIGIPFATQLLVPPTSALQQVIGTTLAVALFSSVLFTSLSGQLGSTFELKSYKRRVRSRVQSTVGSVGACLMMCSVGNWFLLKITAIRQGEAPIAIGLVFFGSLGLCIMQRRVAGAGAKGAVIPFEESPVYDELKTIAAWFGQDGGKLRLQTTRSDSQADELTPEQLATIFRTWLFRLRGPVIPIELFQRVEPHELTAAVSYRYALAAPIKKANFPLRVAGLVLVILFSTALMGMTTAGIIYLLKTRNIGIPAWTASLPAMIMGGSIAFTVRYLAVRMGVLRSTVQRWTDAHAAWRDAHPDKDRDFPAFIAANLATDRLVLALSPESDITVLVSKNGGLLKAAKEGYGLDKDQFLAQVRGRMSASMPVAPPA